MLEPIRPEDIKQEKPEDQRIYIVIPYRAVKDKRFTIQRMRALLTICSYADHKGNQWASVQRFADDLGISKPTMQNHIRWLTENGYLMTINNSYTVGKHAKPRAIIYDVNNPPNPDDWQQAKQDREEVEEEAKAIQEQKVKLVSTNQPNREEMAKPTSLFRVWREGVLKRFGVDQTYDPNLFALLATQYTLEEWLKKTPRTISALGSVPQNARIMLKR